MVSNGGLLSDASVTPRNWHVMRREHAQILGTVLMVIGVGIAMVISGDSNPESIALLSNHHKEAQAVHDAGRLEELTRLAAAAQSEATQAAALKSTEAQKLQVTPDSKVDAEMMLSREAAKKSAMLETKVEAVGSKLRILRKKLRRDNHAKREEGRLLHKVQGGLRDAMLDLHDKEMKVLEARHDVENAAKAGDVSALRDAQKLLKNRKAIAKGARAEYDEKKKLRDQVAAKSHLLQKRSQDVVEAMEQLKAEAHNDKLRSKEESAAAKAIKARANYLRDRAALDSAQTKYSTLAQLLADPSTDHTQVEQTLSKIAANIHSWKELKGEDEKDMAAKVKLYKHARTRLSAKSIALAAVADAARVRVGADSVEKKYRDAGLPTLLQTAAFSGPGAWAAGGSAGAAPAGATELQQQAPAYAGYAAPAAAYGQQAPPQGAYAYAPAAGQQALEGVPLADVQAGAAQYPAAGQYPPQQAPPQQYEQQAPPPQAAAPPSAQSAMSAPPPQAAMLPGAVGNIPYVYNDRQFLPSPLAAGAGFPITWLFADNKTPDPLYFAFQSSDGVMHVYNEIKPHGVTRQQAFGNEYWTILASDKRTVAVQPFKITQNNQWLSIAPAPQQ